MHSDIRSSRLYREIEAQCRILRQPGTGQISDAADVHVSPDGRHAAFCGVFVDSLDGAAPARIVLTDLITRDLRVLSFGPNTDRLPKFSPDGKCIAFLSDRHKAGDFQLYLLDPISGAARSAPRVSGWVEYLHWSPDGRRILLGVAGHGADVSSGQGAVPSQAVAPDLLAWMPSVHTGDEEYRWRSVWVYELGSTVAHRISLPDQNIWEAVWCGGGAWAAVVSSHPAEGMWYSARLHIVDFETGATRELYKPDAQLGYPSGSPSGSHLAIVEAISSDRSFVAGDLRLIDTYSGKIRNLNTGGVDVTHIEWRSDTRLLLAGHRHAETVVGVCDITSGNFCEVWHSTEISTAGRYVVVSGLNEAGDCVLVGESFTRAPEIAVIRDGGYETVKSFDLSGRTELMPTVERVNWTASDGLGLEGWLLRPRSTGPYALVMNIHGGPVWHWRPTWLGRGAALSLSMTRQGYGVFMPNPRGSSGRGQDFARYVLGDMGGADTYDYLSGLDHLIATGIADPARLGVIGTSYGGFMTSWLITQESRFAAAVAVAPITHHVSHHLLSNTPQFASLFLADHYASPGGKYFQRSPIMHAHKVKTPILNICGALDRCTPPQEAAQFHNALLENGARSVLVTYPNEGHGVRKLPATIDYAARAVGWFQEHMPAGPIFSECDLQVASVI